MRRPTPSPPRRRKILIATGVALTTLIAGVYVVNAWRAVRLVAYPDGCSWCLYINHGSLGFFRATLHSPDSTVMWYPSDGDFQWLPSLYGDPGGIVRLKILVPLWIPLLLVATPTGVLIWRSRRDRFGPGACRKCGYDLRGISGSVCPECGSKA